MATEKNKQKGRFRNALFVYKKCNRQEREVGKRKKRKGSIEEFDAAARARGLTYAQAQMEETCRLYQHRKNIPTGYRYAGQK